VERNHRIFVAGGRSFVGRALLARLVASGFTAVGAAGDEPDLTHPASVDRFFERVRPDWVFVVGGRTAGIAGNQRFPADLMVDNLQVALHTIPAAWRSGVRKLLYLSSSCAYPKMAGQPLEPSSLWTGPVEPTSAPYAVAKLAGMSLCNAYRSQHGAAFVTAIGADAYGPGDDFDAENAHVAAALLRRMHEAREADTPFVDVWGSGAATREFIFVDDLADACIFAMRHYEGAEPLNIGTGRYTTIADLAAIVRDVVGYRGEIRFDRSRPDGMPFKGLDSSRLDGLGWRAAWDLPSGLKRTYEWYREQHKS
jgi:GDP-L-fucose synthase